MHPFSSHDKRFRVLVVDDEPAIRGFVERVLQQRYDVVVAADGEAALITADSFSPFDLLVTDLTMPGLAGDELARQLRRRYPQLKILYLTGQSDQLFEKRGALWDDEAYLDKPVGIQGLLEAVALLLVGHVPPPRAVRVAVPGGRVLVGDAIGDVKTLSEHGLMVGLATQMAVGTVCPLVLDLPLGTLRVTGRVVSSHQGLALGEGRAGDWYATAFAFINPGASVMEALRRVVQNASTVA